MSKLFNLMNESSIPNGMFSRSFLNENHVETGIKILESANTKFVQKSKVLFTKISEAEDVKSENSIVREFISDIQRDLNDLQNQICGQSDRFAIAASNSCSVAKEQLNGFNGEVHRSYTDNYTEFNTEKLLNPDFPNMNPYSIFEREFNFIAHLMQELPATASHKDKLDIVSTVYNNFSKVISGNVEDRIHEGMFGDSCKKEPLPDCMFSALRERKESHSIGSEELMAAKTCIIDGDNYIRSITLASDKLVSDLKTIILDLNNIISGSENNKFKVDTKEDGIRNTTYGVDIYTSNKILWLVREKIDQIMKVYSKYILALTVKMEIIMSYIDQSCDIIRSMCYLNANSPSEEPEDDDRSDDDENDDDENDDGHDDDLNTDDDILTSEDESINDEPAPDFEASADEEIEEAMMEFHTALYEYSVACDNLAIVEHVASLLLEEENKEDSSTIDKTKEMVGKVADAKQSLWKKVISSIVKLWSKFKENILNRYKEKVDFLKENEKYINMPAIDAEISMPKINIANLDKISIPDLNYDAMKNSLDSEEAFMQSQNDLKEFVPTGTEESVSQKIKDSVIDPKSKITNAKEINPKEIYANYCSKFLSIMDELKSMTAVIEKGEKTADMLVKQVKATAESTTITAEELYFTNEADFKAGGDTGKDGTDKKEAGDTAIEQRLKVYFSTCGKIIAAKMTVCQKVFDEYNAYLVWHIGKKKDSGKEGTNGKTKETPAAGDGETASKFD